MTRIEMNLISSNHAIVNTIEESLFSSLPSIFNKVSTGKSNLLILFMNFE